jgi:hypothetical protein
MILCPLCESYRFRCDTSEDICSRSFVYRMNCPDCSAHGTATVSRRDLTLMRGVNHLSRYLRSQLIVDQPYLGLPSVIPRTP